MSRHMGRWLVYIPIFFLGLSAFACKGLSLSDLGLADVSGPVARPQSEIFTLLNYFRHLDALPPEKLEEEHRRLEGDFAKGHELLARLKLAILLGRSGTSFRDDERSLELLTKYSQDPAEEDRLLREVSFFLSYFMHRMQGAAEDRLEIARKLSASTEQNRELEAALEGAEKHEKTLKTRIHLLEKKTRRLRKEILKQTQARKKLQKMIDGLKAIEKNLMKREPSVRNGGKGKQSG